MQPAHAVFPDESQPLSAEALDHYLTKLKVKACVASALDEPALLSYLQELFLAHMMAIPFHNFDLRKASQSHPAARKPLVLFDQKKMLAGYNGGYCFQNSELLFRVLQSMGFDVHRSIAKVLNGLAMDSPEALAIPATHMVVVVKIGAHSYLLDPGMIMNGNRKPFLIPAQTECYREIGNTFKIEKREDTYLVSMHLFPDVWKSIFQSSLTPATDKTINLQLLKLQCFPQTLGIRDVICLVAIGTDIGVKTLLCKQDQKGELHFEYKIAPNGKFASSGQSFSDIDRAYNFLISEFGITHISKLKFERYCRQIEWPKLERAAEICFPVDEGEERQVAGKYYY